MDPVALIAAITALVVALTGLGKLFKKVGEIHVLVNARMSEAVERINQLEAVIKKSDQDLPAAMPPATQARVEQLTEALRVSHTDVPDAPHGPHIPSGS